EPGTTAGRINDGGREMPVELLRELEPHGLFTLDPVRLPEGRDVEGTPLGGELAGGLAAVTDMAVDQHQIGAERADLFENGARSGPRGEHVDRETGPPCVGGQRHSRIA